MSQIPTVLTVGNTTMKNHHSYVIEIRLTHSHVQLPPIRNSNMNNFNPLWRKYSNSFSLLCVVYLAVGKVFLFDGSGTQTIVEPAWFEKPRGKLFLVGQTVE